jgi:hypothetical protein
MRRLLITLGWMLLILTVLMEADTAYRGRFVVAEVKNYDPRDIQTFSLTASDGTSFVVMGDGDLPLIKWLTARDKRRIVLDMDDDVLKELRR